MTELAYIDIEQLQSWQGRSETTEDVLWLTQARALAATLDRDPQSLEAGDPLPALYHWALFPLLTRSSDLAADGHAKKGGFMPPVPFPRRMFAGARVEYRGSLCIGTRVERVARIESVRYKEGRSGPLVFVTVAYELSDADGLKLIEEQDIAYRPAIAPKGGAPSVQSSPPKADFSREVVPDERLLFRFSALTFNAHRIHYDLRYAEAEGYPALVVHGPLTAVLLADLVTRETKVDALERFSFRAKSAFFLGDRMTLLGRRAGNSIELTAISDKGVAGLTATAVI